MNLEKQVCSLELAKRLKELGIEQKSIFHWVEFEKEKQIYRTVWEARELDNVIASAFTIEEIFNILPNTFNRDETINFNSLSDDNIISPTDYIILHKYHLRMSKVSAYEDYWYCWAIGYAYDNYGLQISEVTFSKMDINMANAAAKMLIYLIENGLLTMEKCDEKIV